MTGRPPGAAAHDEGSDGSTSNTHRSRLEPSLKPRASHTKPAGHDAALDASQPTVQYPVLAPEVSRHVPGHTWSALEQ